VRRRSVGTWHDLCFGAGRAARPPPRRDRRFGLRVPHPDRPGARAPGLLGDDRLVHGGGPGRPGRRAHGPVRARRGVARPVAPRAAERGSGGAAARLRRRRLDLRAAPRPVPGRRAPPPRQRGAADEAGDRRAAAGAAGLDAVGAAVALGRERPLGAGAGAARAGRDPRAGHHDPRAVRPLGPRSHRGPRQGPLAGGGRAATRPGPGVRGPGRGRVGGGRSPGTRSPREGAGVAVPLGAGGAPAALVRRRALVGAPLRRGARRLAGPGRCPGGRAAATAPQPQRQSRNLTASRSSAVAASGNGAAPWPRATNKSGSAPSCTRRRRTLLARCSERGWA